ncbi:MAG TPA: hypothetical protein ENJ18_09285, partial [Nannocystis exedens]|nr:hypothetical protein [Nannocystis exedens]
MRTLPLSVALFVVCLTFFGACSSAPPKLANPQTSRPAASADLGVLPRVEGAWLADFVAMQRYEELAQQAEKATQYDAAAKLFLAAARASDTVPSPTGMWLRQRAAAAALHAGDDNLALRALEDAADHGFRMLDHVDHADLYDPLRNAPRFLAFREAVKKNAIAYDAAHAEVERARFEFSDVERFWAAYDHAFSGESKSILAQAAIFRTEYLGRGTAGLIDYHHIKTQSTEELVRTLRHLKAYYDGIRAQTLRAKTFEPQMRAGLKRLKALLPYAPVPDVTFVIGRLNSGGTAGPSGMLIGLDIWSYQEGVPMDGISPGMQKAITQVRLEQLPYVVLHEHIHTIQSFANEDTLLEQSLIEGSADFFATLALPDAPPLPNHRWGKAHEAQVWARFKAEMDGTDSSNWIANQNQVDSDEW